MTPKTRGFTIVELLVATGIMVVTIVALSEIFTISSQTARRTSAHAEVIAASAALQQRLTDLLSKIGPGMLIIDSPDPTGGHNSYPLRSDLLGGANHYRITHDRLVFVASGGPDEFQSFTDPTRGTPDNPTQTPVTSSEALIYIGPGMPLINGQGVRFDDDAVGLPGSQWVLAQRAILLVPDLPPLAANAPQPVANWHNGVLGVGLFTDPVGGMLHGGLFGEDALPLPPGPLGPLGSYCVGSMDVVKSEPGVTRADGSTLIRLFQDLSIADLLSMSPNTPPARALWKSNYCPVSISLPDPQAYDYYQRVGAYVQPRLADFHIEWTDGRRINPDGQGTTIDIGTRWFGLRVDPGSVGTPDALKFAASMRRNYSSDTTFAEREAFGMNGQASIIESATDPTGNSAFSAAYRAIWRTDTWQFRPKALRFTYRIYDAESLLKSEKQLHTDEYGDTSPGTANPVLVSRFGEVFSIVVPLP
jgi:type II secretory pathway pseudopilin PulG